MTTWLTDDEQRLWRAWVSTQARLHEAIARDLRGSELSEPEFEVLVLLTDAPDDRLRMSEVARLARWDRSRVSHLVRRMENRGFVARSASADDGRGACVAITPAGRAAIEAAAPGHVDTVRAAFFDHLDDADRAALARVLAHLQTD